MVVPAVAQEPTEEKDDEENKWEEEPDMFEEDRLPEVVKKNGHRSAREIRDQIMLAVAEHTAGIPQSDDITLVVIKRM